MGMAHNSLMTVMTHRLIQPPLRLAVQMTLKRHRLFRSSTQTRHSSLTAAMAALSLTYLKPLTTDVTTHSLTCPDMTQSKSQLRVG